MYTNLYDNVFVRIGKLNLNQKISSIYQKWQVLFLYSKTCYFVKSRLTDKTLNENKEVGKMAENFGLKIGLEGEKEFKSALTEINNSFKVLGNELKHVKSQFDKNDNSVPPLS